ncbi:HAMP domain-containing histidine kinase [Deferribacterales bacterium Es71-Z0220]|uniref:sensor histidine kinase n=1 Tax=Deferrivibrio essentukiensis TaxID=2880922 RepID=UPI001F62521B|nr:sensor histidine kinase [Deferrivibrio essentukiensis]MCB4203990.1 HAMP domain-containing histidine kinase [Deferrivibrio essentukiensis]
MKNIYPSFKTRIILFYIIFGLIPMLLISYHSFNAAAKSILEISHNQTSQLVNNIAAQTEDFYKNTVSDIYQMSENPLVQLSFLQFSYGQRMDTIRDRLILYRANSNIYKSIFLFNKNNTLILAIPENSKNELTIGSGNIAESLNTDFSTFIDSDNIYLMKRVYDFEDLSSPVGLLVFQIEKRKFFRFIDRLKLTDEDVKLIHSNGELIYKNNEISSSLTYKHFQSNVPSLNWTYSVYVPESFLFSKINTLKEKTLLFVFTVTLFALIAALYFAEKLITPIRKVIKGTAEFAKGNFKYRIDIKRGREIKMLADSFNKMAEDIEKRQEELIQVNKLASLGLMSAGIAHEIKNPLAGIKTTAQLLLKRNTNDPNNVLIQSIVEETDRLNRTLKNMLNFAKPTSANIEKISLKQSVEYAINLLKKEVEGKNIKFNVEVEDVYVVVDKDQMTQIFFNLILNAIQSIDKKIGMINIFTETNTSLIKIIIQDNGKGIDSANLNRIFDPFFSLNPDGSGLGLSVVYNLLKQNNIEIKIDSELGVGTKITLTFNGEAN